MKKFFILFACMFCFNAIYGQIIRPKDLEKYSVSNYGKNWEKAALTIKENTELNERSEIVYTEVINCGDKTKDQLYLILNYWATTTFNDANSAIKLNDKDLGTIIVTGYAKDIAQHVGGTSCYNVSIKPIIKLDIKDYKIRLTYTLEYYDVEQVVGAGALSLLAGPSAMLNAKKYNEKWDFSECYPFVNKDKHRKTSAKALVMSYAYSNVIIDKITNAVQRGITGNETDNW